jgi:2-methylcitrate dehydratase PrpD
MHDPLHTLCEFLADTAFAELPPEVVSRARQVTADTLAAVAGAAAEPEMGALTASLIRGRGGTASVVGTPHRVDAATAAFLNATAGTFLEMDEGNQFCGGHPGVHALPPALALAEAGGHDGRAFLLAMVLGYEVGARIGIGGRLRPTMHPHGTWGTVASAVAAAKLDGADAATFREVINAAASLGVATSRKTMLQGGTVRNSYAGFAAQAGMYAVQMVRAGFTGERDGLGAVWGGVVSEQWDPEALRDALGQRYEIARNYFKMHACCRYNHAALDALQALCAEHAFGADEVANVRVETYGLAAQLDDPAPRNTLAAKFSVPFAIASTLVHGDSGLHSFTRDAIGNEQVQALAARVTVAEDPAFSAMLPQRRPARVQLRLRDGRVLRGETVINRGDSEDPYDQDTLTGKYRALTARMWQPAYAEAVFQRAMQVDTLERMQDLLADPLVAAA